MSNHDTLTVTCSNCCGDGVLDTCVDHHYSRGEYGGPIWEKRDCPDCGGTGGVVMSRDDVDEVLSNLADAELKIERLKAENARLKRTVEAQLVQLKIARAS